MGAQRRLQTASRHLRRNAAATNSAIDCWIDTDLAILTGEVDDGMCAKGWRRLTLICQCRPVAGRR